MQTILSSSHTFRLFALVTLFVSLVADVPPASAEDSVTWRSYDVSVEIVSDGSLHVVEEIEIDFDGSFSQGNRVIPKDLVEAFENVEVSVSSDPDSLMPGREVERPDYIRAPGTYVIDDSTDEISIDYAFEPTAEGSSGSNTRFVVIEYDVVGALRVYADETEPWQELRWTALSSDVTGVGDVDQASATITFPEDIPQDQLRFDPEPGTVTPDSVIWKRSELSDGDSLMVLAAFPPITDATEPSWQDEAEELDRKAEREETLGGLSIIAAGGILIMWVLLGIGLWHKGVRDPATGLVAEMLSEPPDDLAPGLVGALVDESFDAKDVVAMLLDLDRRGIISIEERRIADDKGEDSDERFSILLEEPVMDAWHWEHPLLFGLFGDAASLGKRVTFKDLERLRSKHNSKMRDAVEKELFERGFFETTYAGARGKWIRISLIAFGVCVLVIGGMFLWARTLSPWIAAPSVISFIGLMVLLVLSTQAPVKTVSGAETAAKWKAFGRYLKQMQKEMPSQERANLMDRYLPWAVALGFSASWKEWMDAPDGEDVSRRNQPGMWMHVGGNREAVHSSDGDGLQDASTRGLSGIQGSSNSLYAMLNSAVGSLSPGSGSSGASGSSGNSSVGSSGGGSHSFS